MLYAVYYQFFSHEGVVLISIVHNTTLFSGVLDVLHTANMLRNLIIHRLFESMVCGYSHDLLSFYSYY